MAPDLRPAAIDAFENGIETRSWTIVHATEENERPLFGNERYRSLVASTGFPLPPS